MQKISKFKTASVYARAWLDAAKDKKIEDKAFEEAKLLKAAYNQDSALWNLLAAPGDDRKIQRKIIENLAKKDKPIFNYGRNPRSYRRKRQIKGDGPDFG